MEEVKKQRDDMKRELAWTEAVMITQGMTYLPTTDKIQFLKRPPSA